MNVCAAFSHDFLLQYSLTLDLLWMKIHEKHATSIFNSKCILLSLALNTFNVKEAYQQTSKGLNLLQRNGWIIVFGSFKTVH